MKIRVFQPDKPTLLINTVWGSDQQQQDSVLFHDRWVTESQRQQLTAELKAYRAIRSIASLAFFTALLLSLSGAASLATGEGGYSLLTLMACVLLSLLMGFGLLTYRPWARWLAIATAVAIMLFLLFLIADFLLGLENLAPDALLRPIYAPMIPLVVALLMPWLAIRSLYNPIAKVIFAES